MAEEVQAQAAPPAEVTETTVPVAQEEEATAVPAEAVPKTEDEVTQAAVAAIEDPNVGALQPSAEADQAAQPVWNPATGQYYYPGVGEQPGSEAYLQTADYTLPLSAEHYVTAGAEDYSGVAATLSNWDPNATEAANELEMVPPPVNGDQNLAHADPNLGVHAPANGDIAVAPPVIAEKPKKLVLACHFCRGRKLK